MGIRKGAFLFIFVVGLVFAGIFVNHYLRAKAAATETSKLQNHEVSKQFEISKQTNQENNQIDYEALFKKERIKKQTAILAAQRNELTTIMPEHKPAAIVPVTAPPATNEPTTPQPQTPVVENQAPQPAPPTLQPANTTRKTVYLTFDDGPQAFSKDIIALLEAHHFKATFFMIDGNIRRYPDSVKLMVQSGEGVGLHSVSHSKQLFYASVNSVLGELDQNRATLKEVTGVESFLMRTPYGSFPYMTDEYKQAVADHGYLMWDWNIDSKDWYYKDERYIQNVINQIASRAEHNGPLVILLHEKRETLAHLPQLLDYLSGQNFDCKAIDPTVEPVHFK